MYSGWVLWELYVYMKIFSMFSDMKIRYSFTSFYSLKTLFNIVEAWLKKLLNFEGCVVWWCSDGPINSQEYESFEIYAVTIKIFLTEFHHWINGQAHLCQHSSLRGETKKTNPVTCLFLLFSSTSAFEVQFFWGAIFFRTSFLHLIKDTDTDSM